MRPFCPAEERRQAARVTCGRREPAQAGLSSPHPREGGAQAAAHGIAVEECAPPARRRAAEERHRACHCSEAPRHHIVPHRLKHRVAALGQGEEEETRQLWMLWLPAPARSIAQCRLANGSPPLAHHATLEVRSRREDGTLRCPGVRVRRAVLDKPAEDAWPGLSHPWLV